MDQQLQDSLSSINTQLATLNANYGTISRDTGEIKALLEKQDGRLRALENTSATREAQVSNLCSDVSDLKKDVTARNGLVWNAINSLAVAFAAYFGLRS